MIRIQVKKICIYHNSLSLSLSLCVCAYLDSPKLMQTGMSWKMLLQNSHELYLVHFRCYATELNILWIQIIRSWLFCMFDEMFWNKPNNHDTGLVEQNAFTYTFNSLKTLHSLKSMACTLGFQVLNYNRFWDILDSLYG